MTAVHYLTIGELSQEIKQKKISPVEVTRALLERIDSLDGQLDAFATVMADSALQEAQTAEQQIMDGDYRGPLHGIPLAVKDLCYTRGVRTMGGTAVLRDFVPDFDATVVRRFRDAGAVLLGKLNMTEGAMRGYNPQFQAPYNPWDRDMSPGGSSSGSGAATAAGMCFGSLGSDTGGSIRFPSALNGIVGLKPTWGRVSRHGIIDLAQSLDHVGPMTRSVKDAAIMLSVIAGQDPADPTTTPGAAPDLAALVDSGVDNLRVGFAETYATSGIDPETAEAAKQAVGIVEDAGATVIEVEIPDLIEFVAAWRDICPAEAVTAHADFYPERSDEYGPWFRSWLEHGASITAADYARAHHLRLVCNGLVADAFRDIDVLVCPTIISPDMRSSDDELFRTPLDEFGSGRQRFTVPFNYNGAPTVTVPAGLNAKGFPLSVQFVAKPGREDHAVRAARAYEASAGHISLHPAI